MRTSLNSPPRFRLRPGLWLAALAATALFLPSLKAAPAPQAYLKASNTKEGDSFGYAVAISGDTMVIGAPGESSSATGVNGDQNDINAYLSGAAYVFVRDGTNWVQQAYLKASNTGSTDEFGIAVAVSGDTVVIAANGEDSIATGVNSEQYDESADGAGAVYVFVRTGTNWTQQAYLKAANAAAGDGFGYSVAVSGDRVVVGAPGEDCDATGVNGADYYDYAFESGAAYVFVRDGTNWSQEAYLKASNTGENDLFGYAVAVSGNTVVAGAWRESSNATGVNGDQSDNTLAAAGAAYVFVRASGTWSQEAYLKASNTGENDQFGYAVAVAGDTAVITARYENSNASGVNGDQSDGSAAKAGAAYVYARHGTNWSQQAYLKASNTGVNDYFGYSAGVSAGTVVIGARLEDSSATGIDGDQNNNDAMSSGAAYVFARNGTNWSQQAYLKASNAESLDLFGLSVAVSGDTVVAGAVAEASNATGVNGDQSDNSATRAGAAYAFTGLGFGPQLAIEPDSNGGYYIRFTGAPDVAYRTQRGASLTGPWSTIATSLAPLSGLLKVHDTNAPPGQSFYRTVQP